MKVVVRFVARSLLPIARVVWRRLPRFIQDRLRVPVRRVRKVLGLGHWTKPHTAAAKLATEYHPLVALPIGSSVTAPRRCPTVPPKPEVTLVITAHNDGAFIDTALESVRRQDIDAWECVVVDDASVDDTAAIVLRHSEADSRISLVRRDGNVGLAAARNTGIAFARGDYVAFLDADDYFFPNTLGARLSAARDPGDRMVGSWCDWSSVTEVAGFEFQPSRPGKFGPIDYRTGGGENQIISTSPMIRTDIVRSLGGYDDKFRTAEDFEFSTRLFRNGFRLAYAPVVGVAYRQKRMSMIAGDPATHAMNAMRVYDYMSRPLDGSARSDLASKPFIEPPIGIPSVVRRLERLITFLTFALLSGDEEQVRRVYELLPAGLLGPSTFLVDVEGRIDGAIKRHTTRGASLTKSDIDKVEASVKSLLAERTVDTKSAINVEPHFGSIDKTRVETLPPARSRVRSARVMEAAGSWDVLLAADSADAASELLLVGRELTELGLRVAMVDLGSDDHRRALKFEGIYRVADPVGPSRLLISSRGQDIDADVGRHLVVSCEPVPLLTIGSGEFAHLRGRWESLPSDSQVVGWHTRRDRLLLAKSPADGQALRRGAAQVVVIGSPSDEYDVASLRRSCVGYDLVFDPAFNAGSSHTLDSVTFRKVAPFVHAVLVVGDHPAPADALVYGTPVLRLGGERQPGDTQAEGTTVLERISVCEPVPIDGGVLSDDPLSVHVARALEMMES